MKNRFIFFISLLLFLSSCSKHTSLVNRTHEKANILGHISGFQTRAVRSHSDRWMPGDKIGVYATSERLNYFNYPFVRTQKHEFRTEGDDIYYEYDDTELAFTAYYPYKNYLSSEVDSYALNTEHQNPLSQDTLDVLFADVVHSNCEAPSVKLSFSHMMIKIIFNFKAGAGISFDELKNEPIQLILSNVVHDGLFNVSTGSLTLKTDAPIVDNLVLDAVPTVSLDNITYEIYLIPQMFDPLVLNIEVADNTYSTQLQVPVLQNEHQTAPKSTSFSYNVIVNKTSLEITHADIVDWTSEDMGNHEMGMSFVGDSNN